MQQDARLIRHYIGDDLLVNDKRNGNIGNDTQALSDRNELPDSEFLRPHEVGAEVFVELAAIGSVKSYNLSEGNAE